MKAPFPWFGGKSRVAPYIWNRFGTVNNYVEPFAGSLATLLAAPTPCTWETVNDIDGFIVNFWRAVRVDSTEVERHAAGPVTELDLHARHTAIIAARETLTARLRDEPEYCDAKLAGWWLYGISAWIGSGWGTSQTEQLPKLSRSMGCHAYDYRGLSGLAERLKRVRITCGDWKRVLSASATTQMGTTAVFLDPPYPGHERLYGDIDSVFQDVSAWAIEHGDDPQLRIALCGHAGDFESPVGWTTFEWKRKGGTYNTKVEGAECVWLSRHCLPEQRDLFWELVG